MNKNLRPNLIMIKSILASMVFCSNGYLFAQGVNLGGISSPPDAPSVDANGVDVVSGRPYHEKIELSIGGEGIGALPLIRYYSANGFRTNFDNELTYSQPWLKMPTVNVLFGNSSEVFYASSPRKPTGSTAGSSSYKRKDGTYVSFTHLNYYISSSGSISSRSLADYIKFPNGVVWTYNYKDLTYLGANIHRVQSITSNTGYQLKYYYSSDVNPVDYATLQSWGKATRVVAINNAYEYCDPTSNSCSLSMNWPEVIYSASPGYYITVTDPEGGATDYTNFGNVRYPGSSSNNKTYTTSSVVIPCPSSPGCTVTEQMVVTANVNGKTTNYSYSFSAGVMTINSSAPSSEDHSYTAQYYGDILNPGATRYLFGGVTKYTNPVGKSSLYEYQAGVGVYGLQGDLTKITLPEGNYFQYVRDSSGNVTQTLLHAKSGALPDITEARVIGPFSQPTSITDPRGNVTAYTYDTVHGGVLSETGPAVGGISPVKRYAYAQRYAWIKNGTGSYVQAATPVWVKTEERSCRTTATVGSVCAGGAGDEVITTYDYGPNSGPNNLQVRGVTVTADGLTLRTCYLYDSKGNKISETTPRAGLGSCA